MPLPFSSNSNIEFHSSSEKSKIVVEKQNRVTVPGMLSPNSGSKSMSSMPSPPSQANVSAAMQPVPVKDTPSLHSTKDAQVGRALWGSVWLVCMKSGRFQSKSTLLWVLISSDQPYPWPANPLSAQINTKCDPRLSLKMCIIYWLEFYSKYGHFSDKIGQICREIANIFLPGWILKAITEAMIVAKRTQLESHDRGLMHLRG